MRRRLAVVWGLICKKGVRGRTRRVSADTGAGRMVLRAARRGLAVGLLAGAVLPTAVSAAPTTSPGPLPVDGATPFQQGYGDPDGGAWGDHVVESFLADSPFTEAEAERHIRTAVAWWIEHLQFSQLMSPDDTGTYRERPVRQYSTVDEYLAANPRCCYFHVKDMNGYHPGFWFRRRYDYLGLVALNKNRLQFADTGEAFVVIGQTLFIDRDGRVIEPEAR